MANLSVTSTQQDLIFSINNAWYLAYHNDKDVDLKGYGEGSLVTLLSAPEKGDFNVTQQWIEETINGIKKNDDVFQDSFLAGLVLKGVDEAAVSPSVKSYLGTIGNKWIHYLPSSSHLQPGPYAIVEGRLRDVWRIYDDSQQVFMTTFRPGKDHQPLSYRGTGNVPSVVAVPSRMKTNDSESTIMKGLRFAVKDNIHVAGVKTSLGNKAYYDTFPERPTTALCVQKLLDLGGVLVGKTKMNSLGNWEEPTEYIDYQAPWNIRADGFQGSGGSSTGSASAMSGYDWLDVTIGSDTWGSVMRPALWAGVFSLRPTNEAVSKEGLNPSIRFMDMPGLLGRDLTTFREIASAWLDHDKLKPKSKDYTGLVWATDMWNTIDSNQIEIAEKFVKDIEAHLGLQHKKISFAEVWQEHPPEAAGGHTLDEYMVPAIGYLGYLGYHNLDEFRQKHFEKFGKVPYVSPPNQQFWASASKITKEECDEGIKRLDVYRAWFREHLMGGDEGNVMFVLPIENLTPRYRDEPPAFKRPPPGVNQLFLSPLMETPEFVLPVGEIPYHSKITQREERLPFGVGLMTPPGSDLVLMETVQQILEKSGRPTKVSTGRYMWPDKIENDPKL